MKRRNFLQSLAAIGIGSAIVKPTMAEEVKPTPKTYEPIPIHQPEFIINGRDLESALRSQIDEYEHNLQRMLIREYPSRYGIKRH